MLEAMTTQSPYAELLAAIETTNHSVELLGGTTRYWVYGPSDARDTVIIAHGYRGEHHGIEPIIAYLPEVRFISPDLPGFGESTPLTDAAHSIEGYAAWLRMFVDAVAPGGRAIILGHSFGSIVTAAAVAAGLHTPGLILINPIAVSGLAGPRPFVTKLTLAYYALARRLPEKLGRALLGNRLIVQFMSVSLAKTKNPALRRWIHREHQTYFSRFASRDVVVEGFRASISTDVSAFAPRIRVPTLLVAANLDDITPIAAQFHLEKALSDARLVVLEGVGHLIHYEVPHLAADAIRAFFVELRRR